MIKDSNRASYGLEDGDHAYQQVQDSLTNAVLAVLDSPRYAGRAPHTIHPHIRQKHVFALRNGDLSFGPKRLHRIAKALGIRAELKITMPDAA